MVGVDRGHEVITESRWESWHEIIPCNNADNTAFDWWGKGFEKGVGIGAGGGKKVELKLLRLNTLKRIRKI